MAWPGASSAVPSSTVQLSFEATGLRNRDAMGASDPMLVAYGIDPEGKEIELGRSETTPNTLNPKWVYHLTMQFRFEEVQPLRFEVLDIDSNYKEKSSNQFKLKKQDNLGEIRIMLAEILVAPWQKITLPLQAGVHNVNDIIRPSGTLTIRAETVHTGSGRAEEADILFSCSNLENMETFSKSDPFLRISKLQLDGTWTPVYQTESVQNNLNPTWKNVLVNLQQLCSGDKNKTLVLECFDYNSSGRHKLIGEVKTTFNQLAGTCSLTLTRKPKVSKSRGTLTVHSCKISPVVEFIDYVMGGCQISFFVAVDFTASNGDPRSPGSLHFLGNPGHRNAYQTAIQAVGGVLQYYDTDKRFPCWGFGGRVNGGSVNHCFPLNNNYSNPEVEGISGIENAYSQAVQTVELYGPTWFSPVVRAAAAIAMEHKGQHKYFVLLIITDGEILDMQNTIEAIVDASNLPLSLLIVGVGDADFSAMNILDSDKKNLITQSGRVATRDIVQFVPIKGGSLESAAKKLLKELPGQVVSYMKAHRIYPPFYGVS